MHNLNDLTTLLNAIACSLAILFIHSLFWQGAILGFIHTWFEEYDFPEWPRKPVYLCVMCMAPWWGAIYYFLLVEHAINIPFLLEVGGINVIIDTVILSMRDDTEMRNFDREFHD